MKSDVVDEAHVMSLLNFEKVQFVLLAQVGCYIAINMKQQVELWANLWDTCNITV